MRRMLLSLSFLQDDPLHIDFIEAATKLQARCYGIKEESRAWIHQQAAGFVPVMSCTASVAVSLSVMELLKVRVIVDKK